MSRFSCVSQVSLVLVQKPLLGLLLVVVDVEAYWFPIHKLLGSLLEVRVTFVWGLWERWKYWLCVCYIIGSSCYCSCSIYWSGVMWLWDVRVLNTLLFGLFECYWFDYWSCLLSSKSSCSIMEVKFEGTLVQKPFVHTFTSWFAFFLIDGLVIVCIIIFYQQLMGLFTLWYVIWFIGS